MTSTTKLQTKPAAQTRTGKIARLPRAIRDELNRRLDNGETAATLLPWLNDHPDVQETLAAQFDARPINAENLSHWRNGGFQDWLQHEEDLDLTQSILDEATNLAATTIGEEWTDPDDYETSPAGLPLSDRLSAVAALALAKIIRSLSRGNLESPDTQKALLNAIRTLNWLRQSDHRAIRLKMDLLRWEEEKANLRREADYRASMATVCKQPPPIESRIARPPAVAWASCPPSPPAPQIISPAGQSGAAVPTATPSAQAQIMNHQSQAERSEPERSGDSRRQTGELTDLLSEPIINDPPSPEPAPDDPKRSEPEDSEDSRGQTDELTDSPFGPIVDEEEYEAAIGEAVRRLFGNHAATDPPVFPGEST